MRFLIAAAALAALAGSARAEGVCKSLEVKTQAFSDAGQRGDGAAMAADLDPDVIFFNENGEQPTRADLAAATPPPAGTPLRTIKTSDWNCRLYGDTAVTSFVDVADPGAAVEARYRSVETWRKTAAGWKMIGSETLALQQDPDALVLDAKTIDQYVGTYQTATGVKFVFAHEGADLTASANGGSPTVQKAQARDILFTPGHSATPKVFQRGADGRVTGFIYLRGKASLVFTRVA